LHVSHLISLKVLETMSKSGMYIDETMKNLSQIIDLRVLKPIKRLMKKYSIPVFYVGPYPYRYPWYQKFISHDVPIFDFWDYPTKCMGVLAKYSEYRKRFN